MYPIKTSKLRSVLTNAELPETDLFYGLNRILNALAELTLMVQLHIQEIPISLTLN